MDKKRQGTQKRKNTNSTQEEISYFGELKLGLSSFGSDTGLRGHGIVDYSLSMISPYPFLACEGEL